MTSVFVAHCLDSSHSESREYGGQDAQAEETDQRNFLSERYVEKTNDFDGEQKHDEVGDDDCYVLVEIRCSKL